MDLHIRELLHELLRHGTDIRVRQLSGCHGQLILPFIPGQRLIAFCKLIKKKPQHPHAVLKLEISVIPLLLRYFLPCEEIPLISRMDKVKPIFLINLILPSVDHTQDFFCVFFRKWLQRKQPVAKFSQTDRDNGYTLQERQISSQVTDGPFQLFPVIYTFAQYDLPVHLNPALIEHVRFLKRIAREPVVQHPAPQFRVRCLKRDVNGLQPVSYNPFNIMVAHIGQSNIIPLKERKPGIIILEIQGIPHSLRHLINKTEDAFIIAGTILIHEPPAEINPQLFIGIFLNLQLPLFSVRLFDQQNDLFILHVKLIIKNVFNLMPVNLQKLISRFYAHLFRNASRQHGCHCMFMLLHIYSRLPVFCLFTDTRLCHTCHSRIQYSILPNRRKA